MSENALSFFNSLIWHDSELLSLQTVRNHELDEVHLELNLRNVNGQETTPTTLVFEDAIFFFSDIDLQFKRECSDQISSARCTADLDSIRKLQAERLSNSPDALVGYLHFSIRLIPPGGTIDIVAANCSIQPQSG